MRKVCILAVFILMLAAPAFSQNVRVDNVTFSSVQGFPFLPGATITICTAAATGLPCSPTVAGTCLSISDTTCNQSATLTSDALGNYGFWIQPGSYSYTVTKAGFGGFGPKPLTLSCQPASTCTITGPQTINANLTVSGTGTLKNLQTIRMADQFAGADCGAKINAADADLGSSAGEIWVNLNCGAAWTTAVSISANHVLKFIQPGTFTSSATITLSGNNGGMSCSGGRGDNNGSSCLIQEAAASNLATLVQVNGYAIKIENMSLDCNKANNPTGLDCLTLGATAKFEIFNTSVYNAKRNNWVTNASAQDTRCTNSAFFAAGNNGVEILPGTTDFWWTACESVNNANISIHGTTSTSTIGGLHFNGGEASNSNSAGDCIFLDGTGGSINDLQIIGMNLNPCGQIGVHLINVNQFVVANMYITNPGQSANNTYDAIQVSNFGDGTVIGNSILDGGTNCSGHSCMRYGVNIAAESQKNFLGPNTIRGFQTAAYNAGVLDDYLGGVAGTVNQISNNLRLGFPGASNTFELDVTGKSATTTAVLAAGVNGDAAARFNIQAAGQETWGPGTGATDVTFSRLGVGSLGASGSLRATQEIADQGIACTNVEIALSAGWQSTGTATVTGAVGNGQTCGWIITTGTTTAANPTVTDTLTNALPNATTVCELNIHGGTHTAAAGETFQHTTFSATAPVFTFQGTPTAGGTTYFVTRRCGP